MPLKPKSWIKWNTNWHYINVSTTKNRTGKLTAQKQPMYKIDTSAWNNVLTETMEKCLWLIIYSLISNDKIWIKVPTYHHWGIIAPWQEENTSIVFLPVREIKINKDVPQTEVHSEWRYTVQPTTKHRVHACWD